MTMTSMRTELRKIIEPPLRERFNDMATIESITQTFHNQYEVKLTMDQDDYLAEKLCDNDISEFLKGLFNIDGLNFSIDFHIILTNKDNINVNIIF